MTCPARHQFTTDPPGNLATCVVDVPHTLHRDARDREWHTTPGTTTPGTTTLSSAALLISAQLAHGERYGRLLIIARHHGTSWVVEVTDAHEPGVVLVAVPDLTEFEAGREFQRQVEIWRPIGIEQGRAYLDLDAQK